MQQTSIEIDRLVIVIEYFHIDPCCIELDMNQMNLDDFDNETKHIRFQVQV